VALRYRLARSRPLPPRPTRLQPGSVGATSAVKAQIASGRRGKAGAVRKVEKGRAADAATELLGSSVGGLKVEAVLIEEWLEYQRELYVGVAVDSPPGAHRCCWSVAVGSMLRMAPRRWCASAGRSAQGFGPPTFCGRSTGSGWLRGHCHAGTDENSSPRGRRSRAGPGVWLPAGDVCS
jgi:hypothetical protein